MRVRVVEAQGGIEPDRHPHAVADPGQLPHLALPARVGVKGLLQGGVGGRYGGSVLCFATSGLIQTGGSRGGVWPYLDLHVLGLDDVDLVLVAAPDFVVHHGHAADGVMRPAEVHEVVVGQVPLAICPQEPHKCIIIEIQEVLLTVTFAMFLNDVEPGSDDYISVIN